jgi:hypothetical protein
VVDAISRRGADRFEPLEVLIPVNKVGKPFKVYDFCWAPFLQ